MVYNCCYGVCTSDSRNRHKEKMKGVRFIRFPKPYKKRQRWEYNPLLEKVQNAKCQRWIDACHRPTTGPRAFTMKNITRGTYICTKHFVGGNGPTEEHPDPVIVPQVTCNNKPDLKRKKTQTVICSAWGCNNYQDNSFDLSLFHFQKETELCKKWINNLSREDLTGKSASELKNRRVCELHFEKNLLSKNQKR